LTFAALFVSQKFDIGLMFALWAARRAAQRAQNRSRAHRARNDFAQMSSCVMTVRARSARTVKADFGGAPPKFAC
jgi:hypothetical protein